MTSEDESLDDELLAVAAIFGEAVDVSPATVATPARVVVSLPWGTARAEPVVAIFSHVPTTRTWEIEFEGFPRGTVSEVQRRIVEATAAAPPDSPVLFLLVNELRAAVEDLSAAVVPQVVQQKSTFQAHVAQVHSRTDVADALAQLYADSHIARATHNMYAYRIVRDAAGGAVSLADNDDDGEDAAGSRLAHLLDLMGADNLLVVVSRWFGGVLMGPSRFKAICEVAREAVEGGARQAGWYAGRSGKTAITSGGGGVGRATGAGGGAS